MTVEPLDNLLVEFQNISDGECFVFNEEAYIKTETTFDADDWENWNAVCFNDGILTHFDFDEMVIPINAKLVIESKPKGEASENK